jgi:hypothetical protein
MHSFGYQPPYQPPHNPYYPSQPSTFAPKWISGSHGSIPPAAVVGGRDLDGEPLYVGRAFHAGAMLPGKFVPSHGVTYVAWGGKEIAKDVYEVSTRRLLFL